MEGVLYNLTGGGVNGSRNPGGREVLNLKVHPQELHSSLFPLLQLISFGKLLCIFRPLTTFLKVSIHRHTFAAFLKATCDDLKLLRKFASFIKNRLIQVKQTVIFTLN